ncbi:unnamed protein product [Parnassius apollo]|uniref:(apollo) hypothetical protein n=1 Tax=Parnassius apollo TaxID=110799 RepID=A0A8S3XD96_PARAO|nr:unnamed protein product [Parnassius apollo]
MSELTEALYLDIQLKSHHFLLVVIYRADNDKEWNIKDKILYENLSTASAHNTMVIVGDFNYRDIVWPLSYNQSLHDSAQLFQKFYFDSALCQLVTEPTRYQSGNIPSLLDLVMTNEEDLISGITNSAPIGKSDHCVIEFQIQYLISSPSAQGLFRRALHKINYEIVNAELKNKLCSHDWSKSVDEQWMALKDEVEIVLDRHAPLNMVKKKKNLNKPWINASIVELTKQKKILWDSYVADKKCDTKYKAYRDCNNRCVSEARRLRSLYEAKIVESGNKPFYAHLRSCMASKVGLPPVVRDELGNLVVEGSKIAEAFACEFEKTYSLEPDLNNISIPIPRVKNSIDDIKFTSQDVLMVLKSLNVNSATGPDNVPGVFLQSCAETITPVLVNILNESYASGEIPKNWRHAIVTPVFKKGDKLDPANYRPISLTSIVWKCMEKIICKKSKKNPSR